jgi:hypothetical protein
MQFTPQKTVNEYVWDAYSLQYPNKPSIALNTQKRHFIYFILFDLIYRTSEPIFTKPAPLKQGFF